MTKLEEMPKISYEACIPISSNKILGKTFKEIETEFSIKIIHFHNSPIEIATRKDPSPDTKISPGMSIKVVGTWDEIDRFREQYDLF